MDETHLRDELCRVGRSLHARGYVHGSTGNLSARLDDGTVLISATDACLGELTRESLVRVAPDGVAAGGQPSKTLALHRRIYAAAPDARCVLHTHSRHVVAATLRVPAGEDRDDLVPPLTPYFVMKVGHVPLLAYRAPGDPATAERVAEAIAAAARRGAPIRAVVLARLGPNVWHETPAAAMALLEELEETAFLWTCAGQEPDALTRAQIDELRDRFGARW